MNMGFCKKSKANSDLLLISPFQFWPFYSIKKIHLYVQQDISPLGPLPYPRPLLQLNTTSSFHDLFSFISSSSMLLSPSISFSLYLLFLYLLLLHDLFLSLQINAFIVIKTSLTGQQ